MEKLHVPVNDRTEARMPDFAEVTVNINQLYTIYLNEGQLHELLCKTQHIDSLVSTVKYYRSPERE